MKKVCSIAVCILMVFVLSGCNGQQKAALQNIIEQEIQSEDTYTPSSYQSYLTALEYAKNIKDKTFSSKEEISYAKNNLQTAINELYIRPDKSNLSSIVDNAKKIDRNKYTSASCNQLENAITYCTTILNDDNSIQEDVSRAEEQINSSIENLIIAKNGVYKLYCSLDMTANLSVGNEWLKYIEYNGQTIRNGDTITVPLDSGIKIKGTVIESDSVPDSGSGSVYLSGNGIEKTTEIYVRENRGRYSGNYAIWELTCSVTLIERI